LPERLEAVLATVYLIFTEGYAATSGEALVRKDLCAEAIRLGGWCWRPSRAAATRGCCWR
jgi:predicted RNA polymerase sigma factor